MSAPLQRREFVRAPGTGLNFVLSDGALDRHGTRINPKGWDLSNFNRNPIALFGHGRETQVPIGTWADVRVDKDRLVARLELAKEGTSARIDEIRSLIEQDILRATSVGFRPTKFGEAGKSSFDYEEQELVECSVVSVPSNPNALALMRSMNISDETIELALGKHAIEGRAVDSTGKQAASPPPKAKTMTLAERIQAAQAALNDARSALEAHMEQENPDDAKTETLSTDVENKTKALENLQRAERALTVTTADRAAEKPKAAAGGAPAIGRQKQKAREYKPGDLLVRAAVCSFIAKVTGREVEKVLDERYGDDEKTQTYVRAAVTGATTTVTGWAAELVETDTIGFLETLRPISIFPRLAEKGTNMAFGPGRGAIKVPSRSSSPSISGSFVAEGSPIPVRKLALTSITLTPTKMGVISVFTREIARYSTPQIEDLLRQEIQADTAITIDTLLLDATAASTTRPAGLINGVSASTASVLGGYAAILEDINTLAAPFDTANAGRSLVLIMNPAQARMIAMAPGPDGRFGWADQFLGEFTILSSTTVPAGDVFMIDAADFVAVSGAPEFDVSEQAVLHMEDSSPAAISAVGSPNTVAAPVQSMFQTGSIALRMLMDVNWSMRRTGMVRWIDNSDWTPA